MNIIYSSHALKRMGQRGVTYLHVEQVLMQPACVKKSFEGRKEAEGVVEMSEIAIRNLPTSVRSKKAISEHAQKLHAVDFSPQFLTTGTLQLCLPRRKII